MDQVSEIGERIRERVGGLQFPHRIFTVIRSCFSLNFTTGHLCANHFWCPFIVETLFVLLVSSSSTSSTSSEGGYTFLLLLLGHRSCIKCWLTKKGTRYFTLINTTTTTTKYLQWSKRDRALFCLPSFSSRSANRLAQTYYLDDDEALQTIKK